MNKEIFDQTIRLKPLTEEEGVFRYEVRIDESSPIFKGHFPNTPVLPGVLFIEIICRALELQFNKSISIKTATSIKYLSVVDPRVHKVLHLEIAPANEGSPITLTATLKDDATLFYKMKGEFQ